MRLSTILVALAFAALCLFAVPAQAWWCDGHMTIAQIAKDHIEDGVYDKVNDWMKTLGSWGPFPEDASMETAACWADDIKKDNFAMAMWHFLNQPYDPTNFTFVPDPQVGNVVNMLNFMYKALANKEEANEWLNVFSMANLIHFYGDIHQPLHVTELYSKEFPTGDLGGNLFHVTAKGHKMVLHAVWDSICVTYYPNSYNRPLSAADQAKIKALAKYVQDNHTLTQADKDMWNATDMALQGLEYAGKYAYDNNNIKPGDTLSQTYLDNCWWAATKQIDRAGYRLAYELNRLFGSSSKIKKVTAKHLNDRVMQHALDLHENRRQMHQKLQDQFHTAAALNKIAEKHNN